jgi:hypothetical protein
MVLNATLTPEEAAWLLGTSTADVDVRIRTGELTCTRLGTVRVGWRSLAAAIDRDLVDDAQLRAERLQALQTLRAGGDPTVEANASSSSVGGSAAHHEHAASPTAPETGERLALLREAAHTVGGGQSLSCQAFDKWAARSGLALTAAALVGQYGGWNAAKRAAGVAVRERRVRRTATSEDLLAHLRAAADERGDELLTMAEFDAFCVASAIDADAALVTSRFGTWNRAKAAVGLTPRHRGYQQKTTGRTYIATQTGIPGA